MPSQQRGEDENKVNTESAATGSKILVVDASIACAAKNENSLDQTAIACIQLLKAVFNGRYGIAMTDEIENEWRVIRKDMLSYANKWLALMVNRERVAVLENLIDNVLREKVSKTASNPSSRIAMQKDIHLLEAALATNKTVLSRDKKCRKYFQQAASVVAEIKPILWANPEEPNDNAITWLERGAPNEQERQLGYR